MLVTYLPTIAAQHSDGDPKLCTVEHFLGLTSKRLEQKVMYIIDSLKVASVSFLPVTPSTTSHMIKLLSMAQARRTYQFISKLTKEKYIVDIDIANRNELISAISKYRKYLAPSTKPKTKKQAPSPDTCDSHKEQSPMSHQSNKEDPQEVSPATKKELEPIIQALTKYSLDDTDNEPNEEVIRHFTLHRKHFGLPTPLHYNLQSPATLRHHFRAVIMPLQVDYCPSGIGPGTTDDEIQEIDEITA